MCVIRPVVHITLLVCLCSSLQTCKKTHGRRAQILPWLSVYVHTHRLLVFSWARDSLGGGDFTVCTFISIHRVAGTQQAAGITGFSKDCNMNNYRQLLLLRRRGGHVSFYKTDTSLPPSSPLRVYTVHVYFRLFKTKKFIKYSS